MWLMMILCDLELISREEDWVNNGEVEDNFDSKMVVVSKQEDVHKFETSFQNIVSPQWQVPTATGGPS